MPFPLPMWPRSIPPPASRWSIGWPTRFSHDNPPGSRGLSPSPAPFQTKKMKTDTLNLHVRNGLLCFHRESMEKPEFIPGESPGDFARSRLLLSSVSVDSSTAHLASLTPDEFEAHCAPVDYDPAAVSRSAIFRECLVNSLGSEALADSLAADMGACLLGGGLQAMILGLVGQKCASKSLVVEVLRLLLGESRSRGVRPVLAGLPPNPAMASYFWKHEAYSDPAVRLFFMDTERMPASRISDFKKEGKEYGVLQGGSGDLMKAFVGGGGIWDDESAGNPTGGQKMFLFTAPYIPRISPTDDPSPWAAVLRPYLFRAYAGDMPPESAPSLLAREGSAILNLMIAGASRRIRQRREGLSPDTPPAMSELRDTMLMRECPVGAFIKARVTREKGESILCAELFDAYAAHREATGLPLGSKDDFTKRAVVCMKRNFEAGISNSIWGGKGWRGVRLTPVRKS